MDWQDAGDALGNPALRGVHMPKGKAENVSGRNDVHLQYNEVSTCLEYISNILLIFLLVYRI